MVNGTKIEIYDTGMEEKNSSVVYTTRGHTDWVNTYCVSIRPEFNAIGNNYESKKLVGDTLDFVGNRIESLNPPRFTLTCKFPTYEKILSSITEVSTKTSTTNNYTNIINNTGTINSSFGIFTNILVELQSSGNVTGSIYKNGSIIATKTELLSSGNQYLTFDVNDYTDVLQSGDSYTIKLSSTSNIINKNTSESFSGTYFSYTSQDIPNRTGDVFTFSETTTSYERVLKMWHTLGLKKIKGGLGTLAVLVNQDITTQTEVYCIITAIQASEVLNSAIDNISVTISLQMV